MADMAQAVVINEYTPQPDVLLDILRPMFDQIMHILNEMPLDNPFTKTVLTNQIELLIKTIEMSASELRKAKTVLGEEPDYLPIVDTDTISTMGPTGVTGVTGDYCGCSTDLVGVTGECSTEPVGITGTTSTKPVATIKCVGNKYHTYRDAYYTEDSLQIPLYDKEVDVREIARAMIEKRSG